MPYRPQIPVWAPDPAVPLAARLLAYLFAIFMILTVVRAWMMPRPFDYPSFPANWKSETLNGITLQYPADTWQMVSIADADPLVVTELQFSYTPPTSDVLQLNLIALNGQVDAENAEYIVKNRLNAYVPQIPSDEDTPAGWHTFHASSERSKKPIEGAWISRMVGNQTVLLFAYAPTPGWRATKQILSYMSDHLNVASSDAP